MSTTTPTTTTPNGPAPTLASRLSAPLGNARLRYSSSGLNRFMRWWGGELASLLPKSWQALFSEGSARVLYVPTLDAVELRLEEAGKDVLLASVPLEQGVDMQARVDAKLGANRIDRSRWLLLPGGQVLRRRITLPSAATDRLREVVAHEIDRQTPFRLEQVAYDCRVLGVDAVTRTAQVELLVLPKDKLEAALAPLGKLADRLNGVDACDAHGHSLHCNLLPPERRQARNNSMFWLNLALAAIAFFALIFALSQFLDNRSEAVTRLEAEVSKREGEAHLVKALSKQLEDASAGANFLVRKRASEPPMLAVLADISGHIPDNTWLERFSEQDGQIYLTGLSTDAAGLVAKLQASPLLRSPALSGSVQPDAAAKRDRFTLVAQLVSAPSADGTGSGGAHAPASR